MHYRGPDMVVAAAGASITAHRQTCSTGLPASTARRRRSRSRRRSARGTGIAISSSASDAGAGRPAASDLSLFSLQVSPTSSAADVVAPVPEVREKRGLRYSITFAPYTDTGFRLYTGTDPADAPEMMEVIVDVINEAVETLTEAEIARAKAQMKAGLLMALESCSARAEQLARHMLAYGRPLTVEELITRIDAVSVESARNAARALLSRSRPAVVALGSGRGLDTAVTFAEGLTGSKAKARLH